jgi:hypothetical protein
MDRLIPIPVSLDSLRILGTSTEVLFVLVLGLRSVRIGERKGWID